MNRSIRSAGVFVLLATLTLHLVSRGERPAPRPVASHDRELAIPVEELGIAPEQPEGSPASAFELARRGRSPAMVVTTGPFTSVQVNVDGNGNNIVGDAANEPSIAVDPTDPTKMAIGWRHFDTIGNSFRQAGNAYTTDGGQSWTFPGVLDPGQFRSDPVLGSDSNGNFFYSSLSSLSSIEVFKSINGGMTWGPPRPAAGGDKQWIAIDRSGGIGDGNVYQIWNVQFTCCPPGDFTRSTNGGLTFEPAVPVKRPSMKWGTMDVGPDGTLYLVGSRLNSFDGHLFTRSINAKDPAQTPTFDNPLQIDLGGNTGFQGAPNPAGLMGQTWIATDHSGGPAHGYIYVLGSVVPPSGDPMDVMFIRSADGGITWSSPVRVNDDQSGNGAWQWFGTMSVAPNGRIDVIWNDTRNDPGGVQTEVFYASSGDGGVTWTANEPISPSFDPHVGWPQQNKLGDYYHLVSDNTGANLAYAATFNGEQDVYFLRITLDCNDNGVTDDLDIINETSSDCDGNSVPDECDPDCDGNGEPDRCDIANNLLSDFDGDGVPNICDGPAIMLVPISAIGPHTIDQNDITLQAGQFVEFEVRIANWDGDNDGTPLLNSWIAQIDPVGYASGSTGMLAPAWPLCASDADCQAWVHPLSTCGQAYGSPNRCSPVVFDLNRTDYVFAGEVSITAHGQKTLTLRMASVLLVPGINDPGVARFGATVVLDIPTDARGTFTVGFDAETQAMHDTGLPITPITRVPARITVRAPTCTGVNDCSGNGTCAGPDTCDCDSGWTGADCTQFTCNGVNDCSGNGDCVGPNACDCDPGWLTGACSTPDCTELRDCSGHGTCVAPDTCTCDADWLGDSCATPTCTAVNDCSGNGSCVAPNVCDCDSGWISADCSVVAQGDVALVPVGANGLFLRVGEEFIVGPDQVVYMEVRVADWDRELSGMPVLAAAHARVDSSTYASGSQGTLSHFTPDCVTDADCQVAVHPASTCDSGGTCTAGFIDTSRSDYVFSSVTNNASVDLSGPDFRYSAVATVEGVTDSGSSTYMGTLALQVSPDADGTFLVELSSSPGGTLLQDDGGAELAPLDLIAARITVTSDDLYLRKNRFLTIRTGRPDRREAIRVTGVNLTGAFAPLSGTKLWVGQPEPLGESTASVLGSPVPPGDSFTLVAPLQCTPLFLDWTQFTQPIHVYGEMVLPESVYTVQSVDESLDPDGPEENFTPPTTLLTPRWGDLTQGLDVTTGLWSPPNTDLGVPVDIIDVLALISAFQGQVIAPIKPRWDLEGLGTGLIDGSVTIGDVLIDISAFASVPYPFAPTTPPCE